MNLQQSLDAIVLPALTAGESKGLTSSLLDALVHSTLLLAAGVDEKARTPALIRAELSSVATHLDKNHLLHPPFPTQKTSVLLDQLHVVGQQITIEFPEAGKITRTDEQLRQLLFDINDKVRGICAAIDIELAGIDAATAGTNQ